MNYLERVDVNGNTNFIRITDIQAVEISYVYPNRYRVLNRDGDIIMTTEDAAEKAFVDKVMSDNKFITVTTGQKNIVHIAPEFVQSVVFIKSGKEADVSTKFKFGYNTWTTIASEIKALREFIDEQNKDPEPPKPEPVTILDFFHDKDGFYKSYVEFAESHK